MTETAFKVEGMSCGGCVRNVTGVLTALPGVTAVDVSLEDARARVVFDPARVSEAQLRNAVIDAGFDAPR